MNYSWIILAFWVFIIVYASWRERPKGARHVRSR